MSEEEGRFSRYKLKKLLPERDYMLLDRGTRVLSRLHISEEGEPSLVEQQLLAPQELTLVALLMKSFPSWVPYEQLLSAHTGNTPEKCRWILQEAWDAGNAETVLRKISNVMHRARIKLLPFGIDTRPILGTGYVLVRPDAGKGTRWHVQIEDEPVSRR